jgi:hypothetical protein
MNEFTRKRIFIKSGQAKFPPLKHKYKNNAKRGGK